MPGEFPAQRASNAENVSIWWRHHGSPVYLFWTGNIKSLLKQWANRTSPIVSCGQVLLREGHMKNKTWECDPPCTLRNISKRYVSQIAHFTLLLLTHKLKQNPHALTNIFLWIMSVDITLVVRCLNLNPMGCARRHVGGWKCHLIFKGPFTWKSSLSVKRAATLMAHCGEMISKYYW